MRWRRTDERAAPDPAPRTATRPPVVPASPPDWTRQAADQRPVHVGSVVADELARARRRTVARALAEDLGDSGDVTTAATVPPTRTGVGEVVARAAGVVAGVDMIAEVYAQVDPRVAVEAWVLDGDTVARGDVLATVSGPVRSLLTGERVALNLLCHLSGVATQTRRFVDAVAGTGVAIRDTRKTTPGLRLLEKAAVTAGGGTSHRIGLHDALLVKDNHVLAAGGIEAAARQAVERAGGRHVQVEVTRIDQVDAAIRAGVTDLLVDNFSPVEVRHAVQRVAGRASVEASGNITVDNVREYAETGIDRIATGALTHSARWLDIAMDLAQDSTKGWDEEPPTWSDQPTVSPRRA